MDRLDFVQPVVMKWRALRGALKYVENLLTDFAGQIESEAGPMTSMELLGMLSRRLAGNLEEDPEGVRDEAIELAKTFRTSDEFETANRSLLRAKGVFSEWKYVETSRGVCTELPPGCKLSSKDPKLISRKLPDTEGFEVITRKKVWLCAFCEPKPGKPDPVELASSTKHRHE